MESRSMATVTQPTRAKPEPESAAVRPALPRADRVPALPAPPAPCGDEAPTWGDGVAMRIWVVCFFLMGGLLALDMLLGLLRSVG
jgi:hypothetical protein